MGQLPVVRPGHRVVARSDGKGGMFVTVEKVQGRAFAVSAEVQGYVLDARLLMDVLGGMKMPGSWFQVWCKLVAAQDPSYSKDIDRTKAPRGYVRINQRELQKRCSLSAASVSEPSQFFHHIGWMRTAKPGVLQLNPWLTVAGTSAEQEKWQAEWNAAQGPACVIPAPNYPALWREERAQAKKEAEAARRREKVVALPRRRIPARKASA
ncbi:hypothetical protein GCM10010334_84320 [Streptomyces finlayi]|uniref:Uncharacterized protein n=2 Tax=Streptomyces finlayi TaxID=67296 RepID=A0A919CG44_9ACTN|nr:hypothetical protein GCM10010334_84320 [Streptomyces finlayi]